MEGLKVGYRFTVKIDEEAVKRQRRVGSSFLNFAKQADRNYWIMAFMIDRNHQNKGFGKLAMIELIKLITEKHRCSKIILGHNKNNRLASNLYASLGFKEVGQENHEVIRCLELNLSL